MPCPLPPSLHPTPPRPCFRPLSSSSLTPPPTPLPAKPFRFCSSFTSVLRALLLRSLILGILKPRITAVMRTFSFLIILHFGSTSSSPALIDTWHPRAETTAAILTFSFLFILHFGSTSSSSALLHTWHSQAETTAAILTFSFLFIIHFGSTSSSSALLDTWHLPAETTAALLYGSRQ